MSWGVTPPAAGVNFYFCEACQINSNRPGKHRRHFCIGNAASPWSSAYVLCRCPCQDFAPDTR